MNLSDINLFSTYLYKNAGILIANLWFFFFFPEAALRV